MTGLKCARRPTKLPRLPQDGTKRGQDAHDGQQSPQTSPRRAQDALKTRPRHGLSGAPDRRDRRLCLRWLVQRCSPHSLGKETVSMVVKLCWHGVALRSDCAWRLKNLLSQCEASLPLPNTEVRPTPPENRLRPDRTWEMADIR